MGAPMQRPLRQYYDDSISLVVDESLTSADAIMAPWRRHRRRFAAELATLTEEQWAAPSRCAGWDAQDVVNHLVTADGFWVLTLQMAAQSGPTSFIKDFDPTGTPASLVAPLREQSPATTLENFDTGTTAFIDAVEAVTDWSMPSESPVGHPPANIVLAHALWDSWAHERDIFLALGAPPPIETDELLVAAWYTLFFGAIQGGLIGDTAAPGPCGDAPIEASLRFDDLPDDPLHIRIDKGLWLGRADARPVVPAGSALAMVERLLGRDEPETPGLPRDLAAHLDRGANVIR